MAFVFGIAADLPDQRPLGKVHSCFDACGMAAPSFRLRPSFQLAAKAERVRAWPLARPHSDQCRVSCFSLRFGSSDSSIQSPPSVYCASDRRTTVPLLTHTALAGTRGPARRRGAWRGRRARARVRARIAARARARASAGGPHGWSARPRRRRIARAAGAWGARAAGGTSKRAVRKSTRRCQEVSQGLRWARLSSGWVRSTILVAPCGPMSGPHEARMRSAVIPW